MLDADEPPILAGNDQGANPVEYLLRALAGCMMTTMVYHAAVEGIRIDELEMDLEGDLDLRRIGSCLVGFIVEIGRTLTSSKHRKLR